MTTKLERRIERLEQAMPRRKWCSVHDDYVLAHGEAEREAITREIEECRDCQRSDRKPLIITFSLWKKPLEEIQPD